MIGRRKKSASQLIRETQTEGPVCGRPIPGTGERCSRKRGHRGKCK